MAVSPKIAPTPKPAVSHQLQERDSITIRFAGDSGDGMQLAGTQFTNVSAIIGNDISTFPDFPAEIRAPAGSLAGVSGFQVHFSNHDIHTPGDDLNALVAMNPAALHTNLKDLEDGRHPHHQLRRLHRRRPAEGRLQDQSARRRLAQRIPGLSDSHQQAQSRSRRRGPAQHQGSRPLQELLRPGPGLLAL